MNVGTKVNLFADKEKPLLTKDIIINMTILNSILTHLYKTRMHTRTHTQY